MLHVVCEGDDPVRGRRQVAVSETFAVDSDDLCRGDDLSQLHNLNEPNVVRGLMLRFAANQIYTCAGPILIAINPWQSLPLYAPDDTQRYLKSGGGGGAHIFAVASRAFDALSETRGSQSILVSGESGSGKTETCKYLMQHLAALSAEVAGGGVVEGGRLRAAGGIERQVLESNPILEAFGNAKTVRNDNSSRFGKFIQLRFRDGKGQGMMQLCGGAVFTYLLERSRVVTLSESERNYHILYQLCAAANSAAIVPLAGSRGGGGSRRHR